MGLFTRKRTREELAIEQLRESQKNLRRAESDLQKRLDQHLDTIERKARIRSVLAQNHLADRMFDALSERRSNE